jgi:hypothetical protein
MPKPKRPRSPRTPSNFDTAPALVTFLLASVLPPRRFDEVGCVHGYDE